MYGLLAMCHKNIQPWGQEDKETPEANLGDGQVGSQLPRRDNAFRDEKAQGPSWSCGPGKARAHRPRREDAGVRAWKGGRVRLESVMDTVVWLTLTCGEKGTKGSLRAHDQVCFG